MKNIIVIESIGEGVWIELHKPNTLIDMPIAFTEVNNVESSIKERIRNIPSDEHKLDLIYQTEVRKNGEN